MRKRLRGRIVETGRFSDPCAVLRGRKTTRGKAIGRAVAASSGLTNVRGSVN